MLKLQTPVEFAPAQATITYDDHIMLLGSCFADNVAQKFQAAAFDVCANPFGTLYNPVSLVNAVARMDSAVPFTERECVEMGAGAGLICSFSHHTLMARSTKEEFLDNANKSLEEASAFWEKANKVIITLGTSFYYRHNETGEVVANCLKRPAAEFTRERLDASTTAILLARMVKMHPEKDFFFTVSPIRHMSDGAHQNALSKSSLLLAVDTLGDVVNYFPSYEIMMDELRDYRFYTEDMAHPTGQAISYIWERFCDFCMSQDTQKQMHEREKEFRRSQHRPLLSKSTL